MRHRSCNSMTSFLLDQVGDIHRHLIDLGGVVLLDVAEDADVVALDKVDGNALAAEAARPANAMDVELAVVGQIVVDDQRDLLHVDAAALPREGGVGGEEVRSRQTWGCPCNVRRPASRHGGLGCTVAPPLP
eukprot:scaffold18296_cov124-Isochrysis_galbana.AAC.1